MRLLLTILFLLAFFSAFSQTGNFQYLDVQRRFGIAGRTVKGISIDTAMVNASVDSLVTQYALKGYLTNRMGPGIPFGEQHQLLGAKFDNSNILEFLDPVVEGTFITNDEELNAAKQVFVAQQTIFDTWKRFSHGAGTSTTPVKSNTIPGLPSETDSWAFNAGTGQINSTINSISFIGFTSPEKVSRYNNTVSLSASNATDNDYVIYVIAYVEDANDMVANNAYGLNSADFSYPINTTDPFIPNQHTISLLRGRTDQSNPLMQYAIVYDLGKPTQQILVNGSNLVWNTNAAYNGHEADIQIIRDGDIIKALTTNWDDAPGGKGALANQLTFDLSSLAITNKFRGAASYGYGAYSQANASFTILSSSSNVNTIYDLRGGQVWTADVPGNYQIDTSKSLYKDYGIRRILYNPTTEKTLYVKPDRSFSILSDNKVVFDTANDQYEFNQDDFLVQTLAAKQRISIIPKPEMDLIFLTSPAGTITEEDKKRWDFIQFNDSTFLDDRDFADSGTTTNPIRTKPLIVTSIGTIPSYDHNTKVLNIPTGGSTTIPTLQQVTDAGNVTTNSVRAQQHEITNTANPSGEDLGSLMEIDYGSGVRGGMVTLKSRTTNNFYMSLRPTTLTDERLIQFPDKSGTVALLDDLTGLGGSGVTSFNSRTGVVVPQSGDYSAYYAAISHTHTASQITDFMSAARAAISLTTTGTSGAATYDNTTGVINIPNYATGGGTGWLLGGNTLTNSGTQYLGTNNQTALRFFTNGSQRGYFDSTTNGQLVLNNGVRITGSPLANQVSTGNMEFYWSGTTSTLASVARPTTVTFTYQPLQILASATTFNNQISGTIGAFSGMLKSSGSTLPSPATVGTEVYYSGTFGVVGAFDRINTAYKELRLSGSELGFTISNPANMYGKFFPTTGNFALQNAGTYTDIPSARLQVNSTTQGSLPFPRMTSAQRLAITTPAVGLHVYQTDGTEGVYVNKSSGWQFAY